MRHGRDCRVSKLTLDPSGCSHEGPPGNGCTNLTGAAAVHCPLPHLAIATKEMACKVEWTGLHHLFSLAMVLHRIVQPFPLYLTCPLTRPPRSQRSVERGLSRVEQS